MGGGTQAICKYYSSLYKVLEHLRILVCVGGGCAWGCPGTSPWQILREDCTTFERSRIVPGRECASISKN